MNNIIEVYYISELFYDPHMGEYCAVVYNSLGTNDIRAIHNRRNRHIAFGR